MADMPDITEVLAHIRVIGAIAWMIVSRRRPALISFVAISSTNSWTVLIEVSRRDVDLEEVMDATSLWCLPAILKNKLPTLGAIDTSCVVPPQLMINLLA